MCLAASSIVWCWTQPNVLAVTADARVPNVFGCKLYSLVLDTA